MFERHPFRYRFYLRGCLFFILLVSEIGGAQENSETYLSVKKSQIISNHLKEKKIDSLLAVYRIEKKWIILANDLYDYAKWQYKNGSLEKSIKISEECVDIIEKLKSFDKTIHKKAIHNLGLFYGKKGDYMNALNSFKKLTTIGIKDKTTATAYRQTARYYRYLGDFYKAAEYYEISIDVAREIQDIGILLTNSIEAGINYKQIATSESLEKGIEILTKAELLTNNKSGKINYKAPLKKMFALYKQLGNLYNDRDDYDFVKSKLNYDKALKIALKLNDSLSISLVYNNLGYLYLRDNNEESLGYLDKALQYKPDRETASIVYANKSLYFLKRKDKEKALYNIQQSINILSPVLIKDYNDLPSKEVVSVNSYKMELLTSLIDKAKVWLDSDTRNKPNLTNALETLKLADYLVDVIRLESSEQQSKLFWRKIASDIYINAVKTCFYLNKPKEGFYFMEKNKALLLLEDLSLKQQKEHADLPLIVNERQLYLKRQIYIYTSLLNNTSENKDSVRLLLLRTKETYSSFIDSLKTDYNFFYRTQKPATPLTLSETRKEQIKKNEAYIEYILGDDEGFGLLITRNNISFFKIENYTELFELSKKYRSLLEKPLKTKEDVESYRTTAFSIYNNLFPKNISDKILDKKLTIISDSYLQNIPFEALLTSRETNSYFIKQNEISYAYSISFLNKNKKWERVNTKDFLGFAPINFDDNTSNLPLSKEEIMVGVSLFSSDTFLYSDATRKNFIQNANNHTIIHIASHSNTTDSKNPWILFKEKELSLDELYLTENTADLVVLSACKTSLGNLSKGEGVMSLARGFFNTGANSVLSTLWNVNDKSSSEIISEFYRQIKKGKTKSEALRIAKINYINEHQLSQQSPYYWSPFVLIGDSGKIPLENDNTLFFILFLSVIILTTSYLFYRKVKN